MPRKGQKRKWFWRCTFERGSGPFGDPCGAESKRGYTTRRAAEKAGNKHTNNHPAPLFGTGRLLFHMWSEFK